MPVYTFQVYRADCESVRGMKRDRYGVMIGAIRASLAPCAPKTAERLKSEGKTVTHMLTERLFTLARPGDILTGGLATYEVAAVEEVSRGVPYSAIYVERRRENT